MSHCKQCEVYRKRAEELEAWGKQAEEVNEKLNTENIKLRSKLYEKLEIERQYDEEIIKQTHRITQENAILRAVLERYADERYWCAQNERWYWNGGGFEPGYKPAQEVLGRREG